MAAKTLIFVTAGRWQVGAIIRAKQLGYFTIAIDADAQAQGLSVADVAIHADLSQVEKIIVQLTSYQVDGVLSICSEAGMALAGLLREHFNITTGPNSLISQRLVNKGKQRLCWQQHGLAQPTFVIANDLVELQQQLSALKYPLMLKPVDSAGSRGVIKVEASAQLASAFAYAQQFSQSGDVIAEAFMPGQEYTVEAFVHQGQVAIYAITRKTKLANKPVAYRLETAELSMSLQQQIADYINQAVQALAYENGPIHAEIIINQNNIGIVELAGRGGGFLVFEKFIRSASGIDIVTNTLKQAVAEPITVQTITPRYSILEFLPSCAGTVFAIEGLAQANEITDVETGVMVNIGDKVNDACCDGDRMAYFLACGDNEQLAQHALSQAKQLLQIKVK